MLVWEEGQILDTAKTLLIRLVTETSATATVQGSSSISVSTSAQDHTITTITDDHFFCFGLICK